MLLDASQHSHQNASSDLRPSQFRIPLNGTPNKKNRKKSALDLRIHLVALPCPSCAACLMRYWPPSSNYPGSMLLPDILHEKGPSRAKSSMLRDSIVLWSAIPTNYMTTPACHDESLAERGCHNVYDRGTSQSPTPRVPASKFRCPPPPPPKTASIVSEGPNEPEQTASTSRMEKLQKQA